MNLADMTSPAVAGLDRNTPIVLPIAAVEQHGLHLPLATDSLLLGEVVRRAEQQAPDAALFAPLQWLGNSEHHADFPGSQFPSPRVYIDLLEDWLDCFLRHGFNRFLFLNGHGGNVIPAKQAVFELRQKHRDRSDLLLLFTSYWNLATPQIPDLHQSEIGHAGEWETSMILSLRPDLVAQDPATLQTVPFELGFEPAYRGWTTRERSVTGHIGSPQFATAQKGELLFTAFSAGVAQFLGRMRAWSGEGLL